MLDGERPVPPELVWRALECAVTAPNHHATRPWRFVWIDGPERDRIGRIYAEEQVAQGAVPPARLALEAAKMTRAPVVLVAYFTRAPDDVVFFEDTLAMGAALENLVLALGSEGLGVHWRTGRMARSDAFREAVGIGAADSVAGIFHIGYPRRDVPIRPREEVPAQAVTRFLAADRCEGGF